MTDKEAGAAGGEAGGDKKEEAKAEPEAVTMKGGDYMVHVLIQKAKTFKPDPAKPAVDAMFQVSTCGKT